MISDLNRAAYELEPLKTVRPREHTLDHYSTLRPPQYDDANSLQPINFSFNNNLSAVKVIVLKPRDQV